MHCGAMTYKFILQYLLGLLGNQLFPYGYSEAFSFAASSGEDVRTASLSDRRNLTSKTKT